MRDRLTMLGAGLLCAAVMTAAPVIQAQDAPEGPGRLGMEGRGQFAGGQMVRGTVTAVATDKLTIKTDAGDIYQVAISPNTRMMKARQPVKVTDVKVGDSVGAGGELDAPNKTVHALFVMVVDAEQVKQMRENLGKTYITGKVTAIDVDALKLTIERPDKVSQVIAVDEGTSFRRGGRMMMSMVNGSGLLAIGPGPGPGGGQGPGAGPGPNAGESITFADIKVGDMVVGQGSLKNGIFVPTQLGVMDPSQQRRRRAEDSGAQSGATAPKADTAPSATPH